MAIKKIEIRPKGDGTYPDVLYPKTSVDMVEGLQTILDGKANSSHALNQSIHTTQAEKDLVAQFADRFNITKLITNWNDATDNGYYMAQGALNAPDSAWYIGEVINHHPTWVTQRVMSFTDPANTMREYQRTNSQGTWSPWYETSPRKLFTSVSNGKQAIANAITGKGISTPGDAEFATMANNINAISTGRKFATGVVNASSTTLMFQNVSGSTGNWYHVTVTGLNFKPSYIIVWYAPSSWTYNSIYYNDGKADTVKIYGHYNMADTDTRITVMNANARSGYVNNTGFCIPVSSSSMAMNYVAFE